MLILDEKNHKIKEIASIYLIRDIRKNLKNIDFENIFLINFNKKIIYQAFTISPCTFVSATSLSYPITKQINWIGNTKFQLLLTTKNIKNNWLVQKSKDLSLPQSSTTILPTYNDQIDFFFLSGFMNLKKIAWTCVGIIYCIVPL